MSEIIRPPSVCLYGEPGSGKTFSLLTFLRRPQIEGVFVLGTEAGFVDTLLDAVEKLKVPIDKVHWHYVPTSGEGLSKLMEMAAAVGRSTYKTLTDMKPGAAEKRETLQFYDTLKQIENFQCQRTGREFGNVYSWDASRVFVIDSISGLNETARMQTVGWKPTMDQGEWGVAMNLEHMLLHKMKSDLKCFFVATAHVGREENEVTGVSERTIDALGRKNAGKILKDFGEIVLAKRGKTEKDFTWSTSEPRYVLKNRGLPFAENFPPDFSALVDAYNRRRQAAGQPLPPGAKA